MFTPLMNELEQIGAIRIAKWIEQPFIYDQQRRSGREPRFRLRNNRYRNHIRERFNRQIMDCIRIRFTLRDLTCFLTQPSNRIVKGTNVDSIGSASVFVRQAALPARSNQLHPLFRGVEGSATHSYPPLGNRV